ncbi:MAG TPA: glycerate kinase [Syntrophomonadaceae bacterium]|nr:glycerate kinase [Syntrophomonadaceae bacterium]
MKRIVILLCKYSLTCDTGTVDLVITGEGELNYQTIYGKVPIGVISSGF